MSTCTLDSKHRSKDVNHFTWKDMQLISFLKLTIQKQLQLMLVKYSYIDVFMQITSFTYNLL